MPLVGLFGLLRDVPGFSGGVVAGKVDSLFVERNVLDSEVHSSF